MEKLLTATETMHRPKGESTHPQHLFEFGDLKSSPNWYHLYLREVLMAFYLYFGIYKLWLPALNQYLDNHQPKSLLELCSGSGDILPLMVSKLDDAHQHLSVEMSDINPQKEFIDKYKGNPQHHYHEESVDAVSYVHHSNNPVVFINSFHHLPIATARQVIHNHLVNRNDVIILEYVQCSILGFLSIFIGTLTLLLTMPFVVRVRDLPKMIFFTYIVPVFPIMFLWDGLVSCYRSYSPKEMHHMLESFNLTYEIKEDFRRTLFFPAGASSFYLKKGPSN